MPEDFNIDLTQYKTKEVASKIAEIVSVPENIRAVLWTALYSTIFLVVLNSLICAVGNKATVVWMLSTIYALAIAVFLGFVLGLIRVVRQLVARSEKLLQLLLNLSHDVEKDFHAVNRGEKRMPTAIEIVEHVYNEVFLPVVETTVAKSFGIVRAPLLWTYHRTIGGCVRFLITRMKTTSLTRDEKSQIEREASNFAENISSIESAIEKALGCTKIRFKGNTCRIALSGTNRICSCRFRGVGSAWIDLVLELITTLCIAPRRMFVQV